MKPRRHLNPSRFEMLPFTLQPTETTVAPHGFIVTGPEATSLCEMVFARPTRFAGLHCASGQDWAALFSGEKLPPETLPYRKQPPRYLYRVATGLFCEFGLKPDLPDPLLGRLGSYLRRTAGVLGPIALTSGDEGGRLYDFGHALALSSIMAPQSRPAPPAPEEPTP